MLLCKEDGRTSSKKRFIRNLIQGRELVPLCAFFNLLMGHDNSFSLVLHQSTSTFDREATEKPAL